MASSPTGNFILDRLSPRTQAKVLESARVCELPKKTMLCAGGKCPTELHFLTAGIASVKAMLRNGESCETVMLGRAAAPGAYALLGTEAGFTFCEMTVDGASYCIQMDMARRLFHEHEDFRVGLLDFVYDQVRVQELIAVCASNHTLPRRLAKWLLCYTDLLESSNVCVTQEEIAASLSVRRTTVTEALQGFQNRKFLQIKRGEVTVLDRKALLGAACECFEEWQKVAQHRRR